MRSTMPFPDNACQAHALWQTSASQELNVTRASEDVVAAPSTAQRQRTGDGGFYRTVLPLAAVLIFIGALRLAHGADYDYLAEPCDPYYVGVDFPKLTTPQWVGESEVEAVVILAIDDMRDTAKYEAYLRPIIDRVASLPAGGGLSIMTNEVDPQDPQLQEWLNEGVGIEVHTLSHPCPCLKDGDFDAAADTYHGCVDLLGKIPNHRPVAYRMPCCDSMNSPSPRFWKQIFNDASPEGNFLQIDTSVFHVFTNDDPSLPREMFAGESGERRFAKYAEFESFVNVIENYPYPYVIGRLCWQFPCMTPSDWQAQNLHQPHNPRTVSDMQAALDATVEKQGVMNLVFHPHGWIRKEQIVQLVDYAAATYGDKVRFLSFHEAADRLNRHLLAGTALRDAQGRDQGVRLLDLNGDGYLDVVVGNAETRLTRIYDPQRKSWMEYDFPCEIVEERDGAMATTAAFGRLPLKVDGRDDASAVVVSHTDQAQAWRFDQGEWVEAANVVDALDLPREDYRLLLRDIDHDGAAEALLQSNLVSDVYRWDEANDRWRELPFGLPSGAQLWDGDQNDTGLRLVDLDSDGVEDVVFSNEDGYGVYLWDGFERGWSRTRRVGAAGDQGALPLIARRGENYGAWFRKSQFGQSQMWVQNEHTDRLPQVVDRRSNDELLPEVAPADTPQEPNWLQVGAARRDITPPLPIRLHGYASRGEEATAAATPLFARALAIGDEASPPAVLLAVDLLGVPISLTHEVGRRLEQQAGVPRGNVTIAATHTHNGPFLKGVAETLFPEPLPGYQRKQVDEYTDSLATALTETALAALANRRLGRLGWDVGRVRFAANRRTPGGPVDHRLPTLAVHDESGQLIAALATYACHCTTLGAAETRIHGDWAGLAAAKLESDHPGAVALITIGCGADANPHPRHQPGLAEKYGQALAAEVERLLAGTMQPISSPPACRTATVDLPFDTLPTLEQWRQRAKDSGAVGRHARRQLERINNGNELPDVLPYHIATWSFGSELAMVFLSGEVVVDYAIRLNEHFRGEKLWVHAYANDAPCYIPSRRVWQEGGYEGGGAMLYYDQPTRLASTVEDLIVDAVQRITPHEFYSPKVQRDFPAGKSPAEALQSMRLREGQRIELAAAEPLVVDPVAFDWGFDGRLWVVEMRDYPNRAAGRAGGQIVVLEDVDQDGTYDRSQVFADDLPYPTGLKLWRDGLLVTAAPNIWLLRDLDGDGKADERQILYSGFGEGNQQHRVNGLRWGLDNWLHVGNGDSHGIIRSEITGKEIDVSGRDLRIHPDTGALEAESGNTQFGREMNDWGDWFGGNNSDPLWHYVLSDRYLRRNPHLVAPSARRAVPESPGAARVYPASRTLERFNDLHTANRFTSACSPIIYRDDLLGAAFRGNSFVCEPVHNLIHREIVRREGVSFMSRRAEDELESEFLASDDNWFRPVMLRAGPDGALWIADMYRYVIEHPEWIPEDFQRKMDVAAGSDRGRIYRVLPAGSAARPIPKLDAFSTEQLVAALGSRSGWVRDAAQQLLIWRGEQSSVPWLARLTRESEDPRARLHALATLDGMGELDDATLLAALDDKHPAVSRHAIGLCEPRLDADPTVRAAALQRIGDDSPQVLLQLAYTLGATNAKEVAPVLAELIVRHQDNPYLLTAALSSLHSDNVLAVFQNVFQSQSPQASVTLVRRMAQQALAHAPEDAPRILGNWLTANVASGQEDARLAIAAELAEALPASKQGELKALFAQLAAEALQILNDPQASLDARLLAIDLAAGAPAVGDIVYVALGRLLTPQQPTVVQRGAVRALGGLADDRQIAATLLGAWPTAAPNVRAEIFAALTSRPQRASILLDVAENEDGSAVQLTAADRQRLLGHPDDEVRQRAARVFDMQGGSRSEIVSNFADAFQLSASADRGKLVFKKHCAACHRLDAVGHAIGPDLAALTDVSPQAILTAVLDPNRAVENKYLNYAVQTDDGRQLSGMIGEQTSNQLTLVTNEDRREVVLRGQIEQMRSTGKSLMPEGLERDLSRQDVADLIALIRDHRAAPKRFQNNEPQLVASDDSRSLHLPASASAVYGPRLVFEQKHRNLGWWIHADDRAVWEVDIPRAGSYQISLEYACPEEPAGNGCIISIAGERLQTKVESTGSWDRYESRPAGQLRLAPGRTELVVRSAGEVQDFLFDLRSVRLELVE